MYIIPIHRNTRYSGGKIDGFTNCELFNARFFMYEMDVWRQHSTIAILNQVV